MKLVKLGFVGSILLLGSLSVQADMQPPEILASVSDGSVHVLSKSESESIRGEYRTCRYYHGIRQGCYWEPSSHSLPSYESAYGNEWRRALMFHIGSYYVAR
jgi:hypothetical protein